MCVFYILFCIGKPSLRIDMYEWKSLLSTGMVALQSVSVGSRAVEPDFKKSNKKSDAQGAFCIVKAAADVLDG